MFTEKQPFALDTDVGAFPCPGIRLLQKRQTAHASNPNNQRKKSLRRLGNRCHGNGFENLPQRISVCFEVLAFLNQEAGGNGGMVPVASCEDSSTLTSSSAVSPWSDSTSKDPKPIVPMTHVAMFLALLTHNVQRLFPWVQISGVLRYCESSLCNKL